MNPQLALLLLQLTRAKTPEDVFGDLSRPGTDPKSVLKKSYHQWAKVTHPDVYADMEDKEIAQRSFSLLTGWLAQAEMHLFSAGHEQVGPTSSTQPLTLTVAGRQYSLDGSHTEGRVYNHYPAAYEEHGRLHQAVIKIVRCPHDNDLAHNEALAIRRLRQGRHASQYGPYIPELLDSFLYRSGSLEHRANVYPQVQGWYTFSEVRRAYPDGIHPKDMAWMFRRVLAGLGFAHSNQVIHGAVLPTNLWIQPQEHGLMLDTWLYAVIDPHKTACLNLTIDPDYSTWYPGEIARQEPPSPAADIFMAARCMVYLLGGDLHTNRLPPSAPSALGSFLRGCLLPRPNSRPQDAWELLAEFDDLIGRLWGERKFHPFEMPSK